MSLVSFKIAGTERNVLLGTLQIEKVANSRTTLSATIDGYRPTIGAEVVVRDETSAVVFGGTIESYSESGSGGQPLPEYQVQIAAIDYRGIPDRRLVTGTYASQTLKARLTSLISTYLSGAGVTLASGQVTGPTLDAAAYDHRPLTDVLNELSTLTQYVWDIDSSKVLSMWLPSGSTPAPFDLLDSDDLDLLVGDITVTPSRDNYANRVVVRAGTPGVVEQTQTFSGDGISTSFPLTYTFVGGRGYVTVNGIFELMGSGATWDFDAGTNSIVRTSAVPSGQSIVIVYDAQFPFFVTAEDTFEESTYGVWEVLIDKPDIFDRTAAQSVASAELLLRLIPRIEIEYSTYSRGVEPGQSQQITSADRDIDAECLITGVSISNPPNDQVLLYRITAVSSGFVGSWRDVIEQWSGSSGSGVTGGSAGTLAIIQQSNGQAANGNVRAQADTSAEAELGALSILGGGLPVQYGWRVGGRTEGWVGIAVPNHFGAPNGQEFRWYDINQGATLAAAVLSWNPVASTFEFGPMLGGSLQLGEDASSRRLLDIFTLDAHAENGYYERGRTVRMGEWQDYTPVWAGTGGAATMGASTITGRYAEVGNVVYFRGRLTLGAGFAFATGAQTITTPSAAMSTNPETARLRAIDASSGLSYGGPGYLTTTTTLVWFTDTQPAAIMTTTAPFTWAAGDSLVWSGSYEKA